MNRVSERFRRLLSGRGLGDLPCLAVTDGLLHDLWVMEHEVQLWAVLEELAKRLQGGPHPKKKHAYMYIYIYTYMYICIYRYSPSVTAFD